MESDFIDAMVAKRAAANPEFPAMVKAAASADATTLRTDHHDRRLARRLAEDPEFAAGYERQSNSLGRSGHSASESTSGAGTPRSSANGVLQPCSQIASATLAFRERLPIH